jgi:phospholipid/cholesterol/gamma-HCH transport system ATP-binding protein
MIEVKNISKSFGDKVILTDINGVFEQGKTNLIIGASGTGKSVLLKSIVGLIQPDAGQVLYDGRDFLTADTELQKDIRREIGMLFQSSALFDSRNVEQNVMFPLDMLTNKKKDEKLERVNFCLQRVGLENVNKLMPSELSGGMQKRVGIARAIVLNPKYLFCDEPNSGLDPQTSIRIDNLIKEITLEFNITTVVVTHDMNSVLEIGDYIMFIYKGQKLWEGTKTEILHSKVEKLDDFIFAGKVIREMRNLM